MPGADILDVNVGLPEIDEVAMMKQTVYELQGILPLPLQIDTTNAEAMEAAMRIYNGKPMINSVNGKEEVMKEIFPLGTEIRRSGGGTDSGRSRYSHDSRGTSCHCGENLPYCGKLWH